MSELVLLALAVSAASVTITLSAAFRPIRDAVSRRAVAWGILHCPYCLSHWLSFAAVGFYRPWSAWLPVEWLAVVAWGGVCSLFLVELLDRTDR